MYSLENENGDECTFFNWDIPYTSFQLQFNAGTQLVSIASPLAAVAIGRLSSLTTKSRTFSRVHAVVPRRKPYLRSFSTRTLGIT